MQNGKIQNTTTRRENSSIQGLKMEFLRRIATCYSTSMQAKECWPIVKNMGTEQTNCLKPEVKKKKYFVVILSS